MAKNIEYFFQKDNKNLHQRESSLSKHVKGSPPSRGGNGIQPVLFHDKWFDRQRHNNPTADTKKHLESNLSSSRVFYYVLDSSINMYTKNQHCIRMFKHNGVLKKKINNK